MRGLGALPEQAWTVAMSAVWLLLLALSVLAVALLADGLVHRASLAWSWRSTRTAVDHACRVVVRARHRDVPARERADAARPLARLRHPVARMLCEQLQRPRSAPADLEVARAVAAADGGRSGLAALVARIATPVGLGGTVLGIMRAMAEFARQPDSHEPLLSGLSFALGTTGVGVAVAIVANVTLSTVIDPLLARVELDALGVAVRCAEEERAAPVSAVAPDPAPVAPGSEASEVTAARESESGPAPSGREEVA